MPGTSTYTKTLAIISALCQNEDFKYTEEEMWDFLKNTDIKIKQPSTSTKQRHTSAYSMFMKENKKGMDDTTVLAENWANLKSSPDSEEYQRYVLMAQDKDKANGLEPSDGSKSQTQSVEKKLLIELIKTKTLGTPDADKPIFTGKKLDSPINCYKEWKKSQLGLSPSDTISRKDLEQYKSDDNFDISKKTMEGDDWDAYIRNHMIFADI